MRRRQGLGFALSPRIPLPRVKRSAAALPGAAEPAFRQQAQHGPQHAETLSARGQPAGLQTVVLFPQLCLQRRQKKNEPKQSGAGKTNEQNHCLSFGFLPLCRQFRRTIDPAPAGQRRSLGRMPGGQKKTDERTVRHESRRRSDNLSA